MSGDDQDPSATSSKLRDQLDSAELRLKKLERWVKILAIVSAIITVLNFCSAAIMAIAQYKLTSAQGLEQTEKQRISFGLKVTPILLPNGHQFYLKANLKNYSVRELNIFMMNLRVWTATGWQDEYYRDDVSDHVGEILISDTLIADCPDDVCETESQDKKSNGQFWLRKLEPSYSIEATEQDFNLSFGPYEISKQESKEGVWIEGSAYVYEAEHRTCGLDRSEKPAAGDIPVICAQTGTTCKGSGSCTNAHATPEFYSVVYDTRSKIFVFRPFKTQN